ncbi:MAG TPA: hypothetical protein VFQ75_02735 [Candidatus Limnocylindrales bacterium]|nr:hypothetical protein [Candidatus Limnocylindrales bacterium]
MFRAALRLASPAAILMTALVASACVAPAGAANPTASAAPAGVADPSATPAPDPDAVVIRVDLEGGFVAPSVTYGRLPIVVVTADGRVITQGPQVEIYPGPLMPNLQVRTLTPEALQSLLALAREKGLVADASYEFPGIADVPTTVLRITLDGVTTTVSAYALAEAGTDDAMGQPLDPAIASGRAALRSFIDTLTGLPDSAFADQGGAYQATSLRLIATPYVAQPDADWQPVAWPLADLATAGETPLPGDDSLRCQVITGSDVATVLPLLEGANQQTPFRSGDADFTLVVRPMLPGESGC